jgi:hypothetical protein
MLRRIFLGSLVVCLLCAGLSQLPDPGVFGIRDETARIMFYGGSGLLAGLAGLVAAVSGIYLAVTRFAGLSDGQRRFLLTAIIIVSGAVVIAAAIRLYPG